MSTSQPNADAREASPDRVAELEAAARGLAALLAAPGAVDASLALLDTLGNPVARASGPLRPRAPSESPDAAKRGRAPLTCPAVGPDGKVVGEFMLALPSPEDADDAIGEVVRRLGWDRDMARNLDFYRALLENQFDPLMLVMDNQVQYVNQALLDWIGRPASELVGRHPAIFLEGEHRRKALDRIRRLLEGEELSPTEYVYTQEGRAPAHIEVTTRAFVHAGRPALLCVFRDITERKLAEQALRERERELRRSNRDLEEFVYVASHDMKDPLRSVASSIELIRRRIAGADHETDEMIGYALDGLLRMEAMIEGLLGYARAGTGPWRLDTVSSENALHQAQANLRAAIIESGAQVTHGPLPQVRGDFTQLVELFQNLGSNSLKFHGDRPPRVHVTAEPDDSRWLFTVEDQGIGILPEHADRVFNLFERFHTDGGPAGSGMGLAICRRIVERHGGRIWADASVTEGARVCFTLAGTGCNM